MEIGIIALIVFVSLFAIWLIFYFIPVGLWFSALVSGVRISLLQLILMRWRKVPPSTIVSSMIESTKAGLELKELSEVRLNEAAPSSAMWPWRPLPRPSSPSPP